MGMTYVWGRIKSPWMWTPLSIAAVAYDQKGEHYMFLFLAGFNSEMKIENQHIHTFICDCRPLKRTLSVQNVSISSSEIWDISNYGTVFCR